MISASFERLELPLADDFTIARGTREVAENLIVRLDDGEDVGLGGAAPARRYGETPGTVEAVLPELCTAVEEIGDPHHLHRIERRLLEVVREQPAARCALSIALHDLVGKRLDLPLFRYWGLDPAQTVETSFTVGLDTTERMVEKTQAAVDSGYRTIKVKLGTDRDVEIVEAVREAAPDATIRVDANEGWTRREAVRTIESIAPYDVEFVEQPVAATDPEGLRFVYQRSKLPIAADESCVRLDDVSQIADRADIANLKLMKCGGLREAVRMIHAARAHGLEVMLGCMLESNVSIAAACHLVPLVDYADLDGSLLLADDPYEGVAMPDGEIRLADVDGSGTGARQA